MRVVSFLLLLGVAAVVAEKSSNSTGANSTGAGSGSTGANSTGAGSGSSSTGANSTGAGSGSGPTGAGSGSGPTGANSTGCSAQGDCAACFSSSGCGWCFADSSCVEQDTASSSACNGLSPKLPSPLHSIDLTKYGSEVCDFVLCVPALNANAEVLNTIEKDLLGGEKGFDCALAFFECEYNSTTTDCNLDCDLTGVGLDAYKQNCTNLAIGSGSVHGYSYAEIVNLTGTANLTTAPYKETMWTDVPFCVPDTCLSTSNWTNVFADAKHASLADTTDCQKPHASCEVKSVELKHSSGGGGSGSSSSSSSGLSTGAVVAIVLGSLVGVALLFFLGSKTQICLKTRMVQKSDDYQSFEN